MSETQDLVGHTCINLRLPTLGRLYAWEFERDGELGFNGIFQVLNAALDGFGLAHLPEDIARPHIAAGRLRPVLEEWCLPWTGYHLYYPG